LITYLPFPVDVNVSFKVVFQCLFLDLLLFTISSSAVAVSLSFEAEMVSKPNHLKQVVGKNGN
jgi:hypothetical protein